MGARRDGDQVAAGAVLAVHRLHELLEDLSIFVLKGKPRSQLDTRQKERKCVAPHGLSETDDVDVDLLLLEFLGQLDEGSLLGLKRRTHEGHDARLVVLALPVLKGQLRGWGAEEKVREVYNS